MCRLHETVQPSKAAPRRVIKRTSDNIFVIGTLEDTRKCRMVIFLTVIGCPRMASLLLLCLAWIEAMGVKVEQVSAGALSWLRSSCVLLPTVQHRQKAARQAGLTSRMHSLYLGMS